MRKQANSKSVKKHMKNGGMNSFNFHPSPRMVPHVFRPEVQLCEMSIKEFIPRGKKVNDDSPASLVPAYKTKLTDAETDLLAKYFASNSAWRPSLIAFPHFQAFPSPVNKVVHSYRTGMLIDTMQYLQGSTYSQEGKVLPAEEEDISDPCLRGNEVEPHGGTIEDSERFNDPGEEELRTAVLEIDIELEEVDRDSKVEDFQEPKPRLHTFLFGSEFISLDDAGNVLVLSLPQLHLESNAKHKEDSMASACHLVQDSEDDQENNEQAKYSPSHSRSPGFENLVGSGLSDPDAQKEKLLVGSEEVFHTPVSSRTPRDMDFTGGDHDVLVDRDSDLSPRLSNFLKSGVVPESPVNDSGTYNGDRGIFRDPVHVPSPNLQPEFLMSSCKHGEMAVEDGGLSKMDASCSGDNDATRACTPPVPIAEEIQTPSAKPSNTSSSKDWLLDSGVKSETVEQRCRLKRLRRLGDVQMETCPESKEQAGLSRKSRTSKGNENQTSTKRVKGEKKRLKDVALYIEDEAEVSSGEASDDEDDKQYNSSYEDSFIDDNVNPTSASTQADVRTDMMAIYRRSLLSQSPFQRLPNFANKYSPESAVQDSRTDESGSSSGTKHTVTPQTGLNSTARNSHFVSDGLPSVIEESKPQSRKRKLSLLQAQTIPTFNLDREFSLIHEAPVVDSSMQIQVEKIDENKNVFDDDDDDQFYEGIDLDAVEEEAAKLLRYKSECSSQKTESIQQNLGIMGSPSFDLGV